MVLHKRLSTWLVIQPVHTTLCLPPRGVFRCSQLIWHSSVHARHCMPHLQSNDPDRSMGCSCRRAALRGYSQFHTTFSYNDFAYLISIFTRSRTQARQIYAGVLAKLANPCFVLYIEGDLCSNQPCRARTCSDQTRLAHISQLSQHDLQETNEASCLSRGYRSCSDSE